MGVSNKPFTSVEDHFKDSESVPEGREERIKRRKDREYRTGKATVEEARQKAHRGEE
jgi:hypothetical protein